MRISKMESDTMLIWQGTGLAQRRKEAGVTVAQLARRVGLKAKVIYQLECTSLRDIFN